MLINSSSPVPQSAAGVRFSYASFAPALAQTTPRGWGTPRFRLYLRSAEILRWESLALPRTPLPQDDDVLWNLGVGHPY
jgi:hypothetical protein